MKKIILFLFLSFWAGSLCGETVTIGTGTATGNYPLNDLYIYSRSQSLYLASEINMSGTITNLRWYRNDVGADPNAIGTTQIWLMEIPNSTLSGTSWEGPGVLVATISNIDLGAGGGWYDIPITAFYYSGTQNLLVSVYTQNAPYIPPHSKWRYTSTSPAYRMRAGNSDTQNPPNMALSYNRPNIQFELVVTEPSLSVFPANLDFGYVAAGGYSDEKTYQISGFNLTGEPVLINAPTGFEISLTAGGGFGEMLLINYQAPTLPATTIFVRFAPTGDNQDYTGIIINSGGGATDKIVAVTGNSWQHNRWCTSSANNTIDTEILNVTAATINNSSDCSTLAPGPGSLQNRYSNYFYDVPPTDLAQGTSVDFSIEVGTCGGSYNNAIKIFIDFNQDGDFADAGEEVYVSPAFTKGPHFETGTLAIPADAVSGFTMMRVVCQETSSPASIQACLNYGWGETEDYIVNITEGIPQAFYSVHDAYLDQTIEPGQTIWVGGYYTNPDDNFLLEYYGDLLKNEVLPAQSLIKLTGLLPPSAAWDGGYIVVNGVVSFLDNPDFYYPEDATIISLDVTNCMVLYNGSSLPLKSGPDQNFHEKGTEVCDPCKFAIMISGGVNAENNHARYWESLVALYNHKKNVENYCPENIIVHYFNGTAKDARIPQAQVKIAQKDSIGKSFSTISSRVAACTKNGTPATFQKLVFNHGNAAGNINLLGTNVLTPAELKTMQQKIIDSCATKIYDEFLQCYAGYAVDAMSSLNNLNKATIYINSSADKAESWSPVGSSVDAYLAAKLASLAAGNSYENAVVAAKLAYDNFLNQAIIYCHQQAMIWRAKPASALRTQQIANWVSDSTKQAQAICQSRNVTVAPMKNYCEWKRYVVAPGGQLVLDFEGDPKYCGNVTIYKEGAFGIKTKVASWNWNIPGSRRYAPGNERRVINANAASTTVFWVHNDDGTFRLTASSLGKQNLVISPSNPDLYPGFSFGGTDLASSEFGNIVQPQYYYQNIDEIPLELSELPAGLGPQYVPQFNFSFTINPEDEYWTNMELFLNVNQVYQPGVFQVASENSPYYMQTVNITQPGVYIVPLGDMTFAGADGFIAMMAQNVSFSFDCWGLRTAYELNPPMAFAGNDSVICETDIFILSEAQAANYATLQWETSGDGVFDDPTILHPTYTPGPIDLLEGAAQLCLTAYPADPDQNPVTSCLILTLQMVPTVSAGDDATIPEEESYIIPAIAADFSAVMWTTTGSGIFDDPMLLNPTYFPGADDVGSTVSLCISALPVSPCLLSVSDCMDLFVEQSAPITYWLPFTSMPAGTPPEIEVISGDEFNTSIHLLVHGLWVTEKEENGTTFRELTLPEHFTTDEPGKPAIPVIRQLLGLLPETENLEMTIEIMNLITFDGFDVYPFQKLLHEDSTGVFEIDEEFYSTSTIYPAQPGATSGIKSWKELNVADLTFCPIACNPMTKRLIARYEMTFHCTASPGKNGNPRLPLMITNLWNSLYSSKLINYTNLLANPVLNPSLRAKYLIITGDNFYNNILPLANWKTKKGYGVTVKKASAIANPITSKAVYDTISAFYNTCNGYDAYVLLVGDVGSDPTKQIPVYTGYSGLISDYYYSCMGISGDSYPDLFVGRLSAKTTNEVDDMVDVILNYEQNPPTDDWVKKALLVAHKESYPQKYTACKDTIKNHTYVVTTPTFDTQYGGVAGSSNAGVTTAINAGRNIVNYRGHGSETDWWQWNSSFFGLSFTTANVTALNNGNYTPLIYSIACNNNKIDYFSDCIGEVWMKNKKSVSHLGATRSSYTIPNHTFDKNLFFATYDKGINHQGAVNNYANTQMLNHYGSTNTAALANARMYLLLGDPEMEIWTDNPDTLVVIHVDSISIGSQTLTVNVTNNTGVGLFNALVSLWKGNEVLVNQYTNLFGGTSFTINPTSTGAMHVTVTMHNYLPYQDSIIVKGKIADIWIRDCLADNGTVPSNGNCPSWWTSTDLWIDNNSDGIQDAPVVGAINRLYVRPRNLGPANANNVKVDMYYRDNTTGLAYPAGANLIGSLTGLTIPAAGNTSNWVSWTVPAPPSSGGHYCIGAVLSATYDPQTSTSPVWDNNVCCVNIGHLYARAGTPAKEAVQPALADFLLRNPFFEPQTFVLGAELNLPTGWLVEFTNEFLQPLTLPYYVTLAPEEQRLIKLKVIPAPDAPHGEEALVKVIQFYEQGYPSYTAIIGGINFPVVVDLNPPEAISDLSVSEAGNTTLLQWTPVNVDIIGNPEKTACYNIYRGDIPNFEPDLTNRVGRVAIDQDETSPGFQWNDETTRSNYFYIVKVEDEAGYESGNSNLGYIGTSQVVLIPEGWSGISSYLEPVNPAVEAMFSPIMDNLTILYNPAKVYWPVGEIYTLETWDKYSGYVIKVNNNVDLPVSGFDITEKIVNLNPGWNLIPVLSNVPYNIETLLGDLGGLIVAKDVAGTGIFWTQYQINTIGNVYPGKAYYVWTNTGGTINFSPSANKASEINPANAEVMVTPWNPVISTPASHLVAFKVAGDAFRSGDIIGALTLDGWCAGLSEITDPSKPFALLVNGNDKISPQKEGFEDGEPLTYKLFRPSTGEIFDLEVSYNSQMDQGYFANNALSEVNVVKITSTTIADFAGNIIQIYPNPTDGTFTIEGIEGNINVRIYNAFGWEIYHNELNLPAKVDLSSQPKGMYFIKVETYKQIFFRKIVIN